MCTAAKLDRIVIADNAHLVAVFLAEQSHGSHFAGLGDRHIATLVARSGGAHCAVGQTLDLGDLFGSELLEMAEIEAQHIGRHI